MAPRTLSSGPCRINSVKARTKVIIILIGLAVVFCGGGSWLFISNFQKSIIGYTENALIEGDYIMDRLGTTWSEEDLMYFASADFLVATEEEDRTRWLKLMKEKLGFFKSGQGRILGNLAAIEDLAGEEALGTIYENKAVFEKGPATVRIQLIERAKGGGWQMASFVVLDAKGDPDPRFAPVAPAEPEAAPAKGEKKPAADAKGP